MIRWPARWWCTFRAPDFSSCLFEYQFIDPVPLPSRRFIPGRRLQ